MKTLLSLVFTTVFGTYALGLIGVIDMDRPTITIASAKAMWQDNVAHYSSVATAPPAVATSTRSTATSFTERISKQAAERKS